jgi:hypothetical protein
MNHLTSSSTNTSTRPSLQSTPGEAGELEQSHPNELLVEMSLFKDIDLKSAVLQHMLARNLCRFGPRPSKRECLHAAHRALVDYADETVPYPAGLQDSPIIQEQRLELLTPLVLELFKMCMAAERRRRCKEDAALRRYPGTKAVTRSSRVNLGFDRQCLDEPEFIAVSHDRGEFTEISLVNPRLQAMLHDRLHKYGHLLTEGEFRAVSDEVVADYLRHMSRTQVVSTPKAHETRERLALHVVEEMFQLRQAVGQFLNGSSDNGAAPTPVRRSQHSQTSTSPSLQAAHPGAAERRKGAKAASPAPIAASWKPKVKNLLRSLDVQVPIYFRSPRSATERDVSLLGLLRTFNDAMVEANHAGGKKSNSLTAETQVSVKKGGAK